jgi:hypothetical protein
MIVMSVMIHLVYVREGQDIMKTSKRYHTQETPESAGRRRGRQRRTESFSEWMARMDTQVEATYRQVASRLPIERLLIPEQRRIVEMLVEYMRSLPLVQPGEDPWEVPTYDPMRTILRTLFRAKHPDWKPDRNGTYLLDSLPAGQGAEYIRLLRNCAGRSPIEVTDDDRDDRD